MNEEKKPTRGLEILSDKHLAFIKWIVENGIMTKRTLARHLSYEGTQTINNILDGKRRIVRKIAILRLNELMKKYRYTDD